MESKQVDIDASTKTINVYSPVLQAQWFSTDFQLFFQGWNITIEAL